VYVFTIRQDKKSSLVEAADGRRFVVTNRKGVTTICQEGSETPVLSGQGLSFKAACRLLELELGKQ
jgi:hypothetical protein